MIDWNSVDLIDIVEEYANSQNMYIGNRDYMPWIEAEGQLSERFDSENEDWLHEHRDDEIAISEEFNNWTDAMCKNGDLHPEQYDKYCYVGKYS